MMTIILGAEGEYGRRLVRYLETHMDEPVRLRHFTSPDQWDMDESSADIFILSRSFYQKLDDRSGVTDHNVIWITEDEREEGYCLFHTPFRLIEMIWDRLGRSGAETACGSLPRISIVFSPVFEPESFRLMQHLLKEGELYLGMEDMGYMNEPLLQKEDMGRSDFFSWQSGQKGHRDRLPLSKNHMGDLCYYIHLRDEEILSRIRELAENRDGCDILPAPPLFLPLLELTQEDYGWFFEKLRTDNPYSRIWIGAGCGMIGSGRILPYADSLILLSSKEDTIRRTGCDIFMHSSQSGGDSFHGSCEVIFREDVLFDAG